MTDHEVWIALDEFPLYAVSNYGRVMNLNTETIKVPSANQQGIASVNLMSEHKQCRRSVAVLVAKTYLEAPRRETFDTPINLDGDRFNNHIDNLVWRPRWFAVKYHSQFKHPVAFNYEGAVEDVETGEKFMTVRDCAMRYGLLEKEIVLASLNHVPVFPTWQTFQTENW